VVAPRILYFGRIVLNLIFYFFTVSKATDAGVDISFLVLGFFMIFIKQGNFCKIYQLLYFNDGTRPRTLTPATALILTRPPAANSRSISADGASKAVL
jgi:hypothetical protein